MHILTKLLKMQISNNPKYIFFEDNNVDYLNTLVENNNYSSIFLLMDENTEKHCLKIIEHLFNFNFKCLTIPAGESFKTLETCIDIWQKLSDEGADRKSLLINLGGGVVTDIGGFIASCYKRGIDFVHIPTSLLGMVDAAIGGKNGVDFKNLKNQIGVIRNPEMILIKKDFLETLPDEQIVSGFAEILKHGLIDSEDYFLECLKVDNLDLKNVSHLIDKSVEIKSKIVKEDAEEKGLRKVLNYGHTLGHAIESYRMSLAPEKHLLHGEAIAIGLVLETYISYKMYRFPKESLDQLKTCVHKFYNPQSFNDQEQKTIFDLMKFDKKNYKDQINFVLLKNIGEPVLDCQVDNKLIEEAFEYYHD